MATPVIAALPVAPTRGDGPDDYMVKADIFTAALPPFGVQVNTAISWMADTMTASLGYKNAAASSATAADASATTAAGQVTLAAAQVALATTQAGNAATSAAQSLAYAQAAQASTVPTPLPNRFLGTDGVGAVSWKTIPQSFVTGDILDSARALAAPDWLKCDGSLYLQASYPALYALIGPAIKPFNPGVKQPDPAVAVPGVGQAVDISPDETYVAVGSNASPYLTLYKQAGGVLTKLAAVDTPPAGTVNGVSFTGDGGYLVAAHTTSPFVSIYKRTGDTFAKLASPAVLPGGDATGVTSTADGVYTAVVTSGGPVIYKRTGDVFTKLADPSVMPSGTAYAISISKDGIYLVVGSASSPFITIYKRSGDVFTKLADPAVLPSAALIYGSVSISGDASYIAVSPNSGPVVEVYKRSGDVFTKLPAGNLSISFRGRIAFSTDANILLVTADVAPYMAVVGRVGDIFSTNTNPASIPAAQCKTSVISSLNGFLAVSGGNSSGVMLYAAASYDLKLYFQVPTLTNPGTFANIKRFIKT
jgi:hypothetical protein